ncbi:MAG: serine hydrolase [Candidatus Solibacter usitatus]|nr:serine hydrolase [Candidatus Solibacter usitatus]
MGYFLLLLTALCANAAVKPDRIDAIVESVRQAFAVPGIAVAIVDGETVVFQKGYGVKRLGSPEPVTSNTRFAIGSTTKAFTTASMGILVDEGKMSWDDPVRKHLAFFQLSDALADHAVTMRDIVSHRTGLSRHDLLWYNSPWSSEEIIRRIGFVSLTKPFRSTYQYQNIMFLTAGYTVGRIAGSSWESFVRTRIWEPLGMNNSDFSVKDAQTAPDVASPHDRNEKTEKVETVPWRNLDRIAPAGAINSSTADLSRWVAMQLNGGEYRGKRVLKADTIREMHAPQMAIRLDDPNSRAINNGTQMMAYGLGWVVQDYRGLKMVSHGGAIDGFRAQVTLLPEKKLGIVVLANLGNNNVPECLRSALADELLGVEPFEWLKLYQDQQSKIAGAAKDRREKQAQSRRAGTKPSREWAAYAGSYENPAYGVASISVRNDGLEAAWSNWLTRLDHFHFDAFQVDNKRLAESLLEFRLDAKGDIAGMRFLDQEWTKKK